MARRLSDEQRAAMTARLRSNKPARRLSGELTEDIVVVFADCLIQNGVLEAAEWAIPFVNNHPQCDVQVHVIWRRRPWAPIRRAIRACAYECGLTVRVTQYASLGRRYGPGDGLRYMRDGSRYDPARHVLTVRGSELRRGSRRRVLVLAIEFYECRRLQVDECEVGRASDMRWTLQASDVQNTHVCRLYAPTLRELERDLKRWIFDRAA